MELGECLTKNYFEKEKHNAILKYQNGFFDARWCSSFWRDFLSTVVFKNFFAIKTFEG